MLHKSLTRRGTTKFAPGFITYMQVIMCKYLDPDVGVDIKAWLKPNES